jgi:hypothetical protein
VIDTGRERIAFFSGHMHPNKADIRDREMTIMLDVMRKAMDSGVSVLFQGDLNHTPDAPEHKRWTDAGLLDAFEIKGAGDGFTFNSVEPKRRIDYIWVHGPLAKRLRESRALNEGAFRTNREDPQSFALLAIICRSWRHSIERRAVLVISLTRARYTMRRFREVPADSSEAKSH